MAVNVVGKLYKKVKEITPKECAKLTKITNTNIGKFKIFRARYIAL